MAMVKLRILGECVIEVGDRSIGPESPQLFALALRIGSTDRSTINKGEIRELLFPEEPQSSHARHNLRQLLYRLRSLGAPLESHGEQTWIDSNYLRTPLDLLASHSRKHRQSIGVERFSVLPSYQPDISPAFDDWTESLRQRLGAQVRSLVAEDLWSSRKECDWQGVIASGNVLHAIGGGGETTMAAMAESLMMLGQPQVALARVDAYLDDNPAAASSLVKLRKRIMRSPERVGKRYSAFMGRRPVMQALENQWAQAISGVPQLAAVIGPPGIGKSRLAKEFLSIAMVQGAQHVEYRSDHNDLSRPHSLFSSLLPQLRGLRGSLGASPEHFPLLERLAGNLPSTSSQEAVGSEALRALLQDAIVDLVAAVAAESPLLLLLDDAHLLDSASQGVVRALTAQRYPCPVMVICCLRPTESIPLLLSNTERASVHRLPPLEEDECVAVLRNLLPDAQPDAFLYSCIQRSGGNPYYLHALANDSRDKEDSPGTPFDVRRFAAVAYYSLAPDSRALFEAALLLGSFATIQRVRLVASVEGASLLGALRDLENRGVVSFSDGVIRCSHDLLSEACIPLIPSAVAAELHDRIGELLAGEARSLGLPLTLSWEAAGHLLVAGKADAAVELLERCATHAAALGEPRTAVDALQRIPQNLVALPVRRRLLNQIADYSMSAGEMAQAGASLRTLRDTYQPDEAPDHVTRELSLRIIEAELWGGSDPRDVVGLALELLRDGELPAPLRLRAGIRLLIAADMMLDRSLAESTFAEINTFSSANTCEQAYLRAALIFHTSFGDPQVSFTHCEEIVRQHSTPRLTNDWVLARRNAAFAYLRLGHLQRVRSVVVDDLAFLRRHRVSSEVLYRLIVLAQNALQEGDLEETNAWLRQAEELAADPVLGTSMQPGYYSVAATIALREGRTLDAQALMTKARVTCPTVQVARSYGVTLSIALQTKLALERVVSADDPLLAELEQYYSGARSLGVQDTVVESLWLAYCALGRNAEASLLLSDYLANHKRELTAPDWCLRNSTAADPAWLKYGR